MAKRKEKDMEEVKNLKIDPQNAEGADVIVKSQDFVQQNKGMITVVSIVIIAIIALAYYYRVKTAEDIKEASVELSRITPLYQEGEYEKALNGDPEYTVRGENVLGLTQIAEEYSGTEQGRLAALYAGKSYLHLGDFVNAKKYFDIALDSDAELTRMGANAGLAVCYENDGSYSEAASYYEQAANLAPKSEIKYRYMYFSGLCFEKAENKQKASKLYKDIVFMSDKSQYAGEARVRLDAIGTVIE
jgi:tetratricopeptide (TPR) repeat protein